MNKKILEDVIEHLDMTNAFIIELIQDNNQQIINCPNEKKAKKHLSRHFKMVTMLGANGVMLESLPSPENAKM